jgi:hypothetical protein
VKSWKFVATESIGGCAQGHFLLESEDVGKLEFSGKVWNTYSFG